MRERERESNDIFLWLEILTVYVVYVRWYGEEWIVGEACARVTLARWGWCWVRGLHGAVGSQGEVEVWLWRLQSE